MFPISVSCGSCDAQRTISPADSSRRYTRHASHSVTVTTRPINSPSIRSNGHPELTIPLTLCSNASCVPSSRHRSHSSLKNVLRLTLVFPTARFETPGPTRHPQMAYRKTSSKLCLSKDADRPVTCTAGKLDVHSPRYMFAGEFRVSLQVCGIGETRRRGLAAEHALHLRPCAGEARFNSSRRNAQACSDL